MQHDAEETVHDIIHRVKTPAAPEPDLRDAEVFKGVFEEKNRHLGLYYTKDTMDGFYDILDDLAHLYQKQEGKPLSARFEWSTKVQELETLIKGLKN